MPESRRQSGFPQALADSHASSNSLKRKDAQEHKDDPAVSRARFAADERQSDPLSEQTDDAASVSESASGGYTAVLMAIGESLLDFLLLYAGHQGGRI